MAKSSKSPGRKVPGPASVDCEVNLQGKGVSATGIGETLGGRADAIVYGPGAHAGGSGASKGGRKSAERKKKVAAAWKADIEPEIKRLIAAGRRDSDIASLLRRQDKTAWRSIPFARSSQQCEKSWASSATDQQPA